MGLFSLDRLAVIFLEKAKRVAGGGGGLLGWEPGDLGYRPSRFWCILPGRPPETNCLNSESRPPGSRCDLGQVI